MRATGKLPPVLGCLWLGLALLLVAGCAGPKVDWNAQVGVYTHDQAVLDLGPPDKAATISDGTQVLEWMTRSGTGGGYVGFAGAGRYGPYGYRPYYGPAYGGYYAPGNPSYWLRLVFDRDGVLMSWKKYTR